jgi:hypothetical protein
METWSDREKKLARRVFDAALAAELAEVMADFKASAAAAAEPNDMWSIQEHLYHKRREIDEKYDYSHLLFVFGRLVREGRIAPAYARRSVPRCASPRSGPHTTSASFW